MTVSTGAEVSPNILVYMANALKTKKKSFKWLDVSSLSLNATLEKTKRAR